MEEAGDRGVKTSLSPGRVRVLYSFPHRLGATRICYTAWEQVRGIADAGAEVLLCPASLRRAVPAGVEVLPTLARGPFRIPYRILGSMRAFGLHDRIVSRRLEKIADKVDIVHTWPLGGLRTMKTAARLGIPTVLERPNAHTRYAFDVVRQECERLGVSLPPNHEHAHKDDVLRIEEEEYLTAYRILCPSPFVEKTFLDRGFSAETLARHFYGVDAKRFYPRDVPRDISSPFTALFVGVAAVRKGLHFALDAWLASRAHDSGVFMIAGDILPAYAERLASALAHPSVHVLGHRTDVPELMRNSDVLILPTIEEGCPLVCGEAIASGCVPVVSTVCTGICRHLENALIHPVGDVEALAAHLTLLFKERQLLGRLRATGLCDVPEITWAAAGRSLVRVYQEALAAYRGRRPAAVSS